ncbi:hypothetical protein DPM19_07250 [Actinomadura craniellae]|uniref:HTH cro/C1-type domain-containing protein n=1 Tax=Actinomadura craniellae TaxID=2231787 RepID=A0A365H987_9ACTN|nr:helix-turn-helix transcriptional regulator [Actinomadura craniellae]RAY15582.1 hypothetical protein DPM19_07250 [Actinomadura craniellae]
MYPRQSIDPLSSMWAWLAHDLRFYRMRAGLTGEMFGKIMGVVRSTVSRMESGEYRINDDHARALDQHFNTGGHFARLLHYARLGHDPGWFMEHVGIESQAEVVRNYELSLIPGLLQTKAYARALFTAAGSMDVETQVAARMARQEILNREEPPFLWVLMDESVLHRMIGGSEVMKEQLAWLLEVSERPNVGLRVIPANTGFHLGLEGSFVVFSLKSGDVAYVEATEGGRLIRGAPEVRSVMQRYERIGAKALPEDSSRSLIQQVMEAL